MAKKKYYLHTINGQPGGFGGKQVHWGWHGLTLAKSLKQIRKEQKKSRAYREANKFHAFGYSYVLVYLPD